MAKTKLSKGTKVMVKRVNGASVSGYTHKTVECEITRVFGTCYEIAAVNGEQVLPNQISRVASDWWWEA